MERIRYYLLNCLLLTVPILLWNILLGDTLPAAYQQDVFWKDIPWYLSTGEHVFRIVVFAMAAFIPLEKGRLFSWPGGWLYIGGTLIYFASWLVLIFFPETYWSNSLLGFMAPSYTPILWLLGIGLIGQKFYVRICCQRVLFFTASALFMIFHNAHVMLIWFRMQ